MPPSRTAPLLRSTSRCLLALRLRPTTTAPAGLLPSAASRGPLSTIAAATSPARRPSLAASRRTALWPATRSYADDATTRHEQQPAGAAADTEAEPSIPVAELPEQQVDTAELTPENREALRQLELLSRGLAPFDPAVDGHKFGLTTATTRAATAEQLDADADADAGDLKLPHARRLQERYDPVIMQLTRLLMRDGKLSKAQREMAMVLNLLRTSRPPKLNPARPLLAGAPPPAQLPLDPVRYLTLAIDSVAPLIKVKNFAGLAGGGRSLPVPFPLAERQRRRLAFMWLLDIVNRKPSRGSGRAMLAQRVADEVVAVVEGRSNLWEKRQAMHKQGTSARINVKALKR